jgi:hypothetical protein
MLDVGTERVKPRAWRVLAGELEGAGGGEVGRGLCGVAHTPALDAGSA